MLVGPHNNCRNPDGSEGAWCYTTKSWQRWEYCDVRQCSYCDEGNKQETIYFLTWKF